MKTQHPTRSTLGSHVATAGALSRRRFLQGVGVVLALPMLDSMMPLSALAGEPSDGGAPAKPRRMLAICNNLGLLPGEFFPA
jgi:hypothetical protein